jgi:hypothetical protein
MTVVFIVAFVLAENRSFLAVFAVRVGTANTRNRAIRAGGCHVNR